MVLRCRLHPRWPPRLRTLFQLVTRILLAPAVDVTHGLSRPDQGRLHLADPAPRWPCWFCRYSDSLLPSPSSTGPECLFRVLCYGSLRHQPCQHDGSPVGPQWSASFCHLPESPRGHVNLSDAPRAQGKAQDSLCPGLARGYPVKGLPPTAL